MKKIKITFSDEKSNESQIWLSRIIERIVIDQLEIDPKLKAELLMQSGKNTMSLIKRRAKNDS
ncbi:hypothetical protein ACNQFZ_11380 [Schinkia sp. CFF1]